MLVEERLVPNREVGGDIRQELMCEGKLSEAPWAQSNCQYRQWAT